MKTKLLKKIRRRFSVNYINGKWHIIDLKDCSLVVHKDTLGALVYIVDKLGYKDYSIISMLRRKCIIDERIRQVLQKQFSNN